MISDYVTTPIAARLLGIGEPLLRQLVRAGRIEACGGKHKWFRIADLETARGAAITEADLAFATDRHRRRLDAYQRYNQKRGAAA